MTCRYGRLLVLAACAFVLAAGCRPAPPASATITMHYSRFAPGVVAVPAGVPVTIRLHNEDPIDHEWIVGAAEIHARHRTGTEPYHDELPTEVTVPALSEMATTVTFDEPGDYAYICHLPGHEAYGMVGTLRVVGE